jgi:shikimate 5-dehydrogenase
MGYPVEMIGKDTALYSIIGVDAIEHKIESYFNKHFKEADVDRFVMPLNIREDDIGFFLYNFKNSKVKGAYFEREFWSIVANLLDEKDEEAKICGMVDSLDVVDGKNRAYVTLGKAVVSLLDPKGKSVAVFGNTPAIKSALYHLNKSEVKEIILYDEVVENTLTLSEITKDISLDVERITDGKVSCEADLVIVDRDDLIIECNAKVFDLQKNYSELLEEIAKIKTKEWMRDG